MPWYLPALLAAIGWGLYYPIAEILVKRYSTPFLLSTTYLLSSVVITVMFFPRIKSDFKALGAVSKTDIFLIILLELLAFACNYLGFIGISLKNATLAAFMEISYPVFSAIFAYLLFNHSTLTPWTGIGGLLIGSGVVLIALKG